jgi:exosome complex component CSL4
MATVTIPGQVLGSTSTHLPGPGTHVFDSKIYASITGSTATTPPTTKDGKPVISVPRHGNTQTSPSLTKNSTLPVVGSIVLCRVVRVQQRQAIASILVVDPASSNTTSLIIPYASLTNEDLQFQAVLRREDIRAYEKDKIVLNEMYRVGDIIRASVISLGDERQYYISTAGNEFGVVVATSEDGNAMVPASWKEMRDVVTGKAESRKVAKPT